MRAACAGIASFFCRELAGRHGFRSALVATDELRGARRFASEYLHPADPARVYRIVRAGNSQRRTHAHSIALGSIARHQRWSFLPDS